MNVTEWKILSEEGYLGLIGLEMPILRRLGRVGVRGMRIHGKPALVLDENIMEYFVEIVSVYGHLLLARDEIRKWQAEVHGNFTHAKYHFYAFVFNAKAFLDKVAAHINSEYHLGFSGGAVDVRRKEFVEALAKKRPRLGRELRRLRKWFRNVARWRDHLIHRQGLWLVTVLTEGVRQYQRATRQIQLPSQPLSPTEVTRRYIRMPAMCDKWLINAERLLNLVAEDYTRSIQKHWPVKKRDRISKKPFASIGSNRRRPADKRRVITAEAGRKVESSSPSKPSG